MYKLPEKLKSFTPYEPLVGNYPIRLDANESFLELPTEEIVRFVVEGVNRSSRLKFNRYPDPNATQVVEEFAKLFNISPRCVTAGNGSDELIGVIASGLLEKGDKLLTLAPDFPMYSFYSRLYELEVVELPKNNDFEVDINQTIEFINSNNIKCIMLSNPCNPTSLGVKKDELMRLVTETGSLIVIDEAYMDFWDETQSTLCEIENYSNLIVLRTCSKSVALAGIRLGFAVACEYITNALRTVKSPFNVNSISQAIGAAILSDTVGYKKAIEFIKESTDMLRLGLIGLLKLGVFEKVYETRTNFVFVKVEQAQEIYEYLLTKGIAVRCFGNHLRICAGTREEMNELCKELATWQVLKMQETGEFGNL